MRSDGQGHQQQRLQSALVERPHVAKPHSPYCSRNRPSPLAVPRKAPRATPTEGNRLASTACLSTTSSKLHRYDYYERPRGQVPLNHWRKHSTVHSRSSRPDEQQQWQATGHQHAADRSSAAAHQPTQNSRSRGCGKKECRECLRELAYNRRSRPTTSHVRVANASPSDSKRTVPLSVRDASAAATDRAYRDGHSKPHKVITERGVGSESLSTTSATTGSKSEHSSTKGSTETMVIGSEADWNSQDGRHETQLFQRFKSGTARNQSLDLDSQTNWEDHPDLMKVVRTEVAACPDYIQAKNPDFQKTPVSPFSLYYFDETAPNKVLIDNDVRRPAAAEQAKGSVMVTTKGEEFDDQGNPVPIVTTRGGGGQADNDGDHENTSSDYFVRSYYTESAFTTVTAGVIGASSSKGAKKKRGCCGGTTGVDSNYTDGDNMSLRRDSPLVLQRPTAGVENQHQRLTPLMTSALDLTSISQPSLTQGPVAANWPAAGAVTTQSSLNRNTLPAQTSQQTTARTVTVPVTTTSLLCPGNPVHNTPIHMDYLKEAYGALGKETRFSKVRSTNQVDYKPISALANRYQHPAYVSAVQQERHRQEELKCQRPAYPLISDKSPCDLDSTGVVVQRGGDAAFSEACTSSSGTYTQKTRKSEKNDLPSSLRQVKARGDAATTPRKQTVSGKAAPPPTTTTGCRKKVCPACRRAFLSSEPMRSCGVRSTSATASFTVAARGRSGAPRRASSSTGSLSETVSGDNDDDMASHNLEAPGQKVFLRDGTFVKKKPMPSYKIPQMKEKEKDLGYLLRKHYCNVKNMKVPSDGTAFKSVPQYSTSYKNYPNLAYDVVVPTNNKHFYHVRHAPAFFSG